MKRAVGWLEPHMEAEKAAGTVAQSAGRIVLATVKGDVHDIGKNIVGVVLGCNGYEVLDLGVMVPAAKILATAREVGAQAIGLSGLITPSLDEMVHVAAEMAREGFDLPLLIGGATTSREHTAVKIAPAYPHTVLHVLDASRAVAAVAGVMDPVKRAATDERNRAEQARIREVHAQKAARPLDPLPVARANRAALAFRADELGTPAFLGARPIEVPIADLVPYIDWRFFFTAWELPGRFPEVLDDPACGAAARELFGNAQTLLRRIVDEGLLTARGTYGFWPAVADGDDVVLFDDAGRTRERVRFPMLRQQGVRGAGEPHASLADFVAPRESGVPDHVGAFAVTAGLGLDALVARFEAARDDYGAILAKALADRLAEAFAEWLHERARREWYAPDERLEPAALLKERFRGIRPAFGYPACPDHSEKPKLFALLGATSAGMQLTESFAMVPAASVSGIYLGHPAARYFAVGRIGRDQVTDYARRKGVPVAEVERWLSPNLGYDPKAEAAPAAA
jgi:5-methyltetrahydrofolate--homocysteine methyltransferase